MSAVPYPLLSILCMARKADGQGDAGLSSPAILLSGSLFTDCIWTSFPSHPLCSGRALARGEAGVISPSLAVLLHLSHVRAFRPPGKNSSPHRCSWSLQVFLLSIAFPWNVCRVCSRFQKALGIFLLMNDFCLFNSLEL